MIYLWTLVVIPAALITKWIMWWFSPRVFMVLKDSSITITRRTKMRGNAYSYLTTYDVRCAACGWYTQIYGGSLKNLSEYGQLKHDIEPHKCPTIDDLANEKWMTL